MDNRCLICGEIIPEGLQVCTKSEKNENVDHPSHYTDGKIEVIDFIEDKNLGFHLGNAIKYISRAGKKDKNKPLRIYRKQFGILTDILKN